MTRARRNINDTGAAVAALSARIVDCRRCDRLTAWCAAIGRDKRAAYAADRYWARPVPGFGDPAARLVVVGLAPGAHGANRTGRVFTGDRSGEWLYRALHRAGFANQPTATSRDDGLVLRDAWVTVTVRCAPPDNKPTPDERDTCLPFLVEELTLLSRARVLVCLGAFAWDGILRALAALGAAAAEAAPQVRARRRSHRRTLHAPRLLPPVAAEHLHRQAHRADARRRLHARPRAGARMSLLPRDHSGPAVARLFHRLLAVVFLDAWLSLGVQVHTLIGSRGLLPAADFLARARHQLSFTEFPTLFWLGVSDATLTLGIVAGVALSLVALAGRAPRAIAAVQVALYLSYATVGRTFLGFQWDNLLIECGFFAIFLSRTRRAPLVHLLFRLILFKLYWESGIAKWQSHLHDWQDGSAMTYYYETAPLPTALAWYFHHAPVFWHHLESWATLALELVVPFAIFARPRRVRLAVAAILTGFQVVNAATANYGFFCYLAAALHVFLLDDSDVTRAAAWVRARLRLRLRAPAADLPESKPRWPAALLLGLFVAVSAVDAVVSFVDAPGLFAVLLPARRLYAPFRIVNTYHLFGHITRARIEPEFQTSDDGTTWVTHQFRHKPGDPMRRPDWVAPHQPRVDFQLWFYGLGYKSGAPEYVTKLLERLCRAPDAVQSLFSTPPSPHPRAARIIYWQYHFTTAAERRATGAWWTREPLDVTDAVPCDTRFPDGDPTNDE